MATVQKSWFVRRSGLGLRTTLASVRVARNRNVLCRRVQAQHVGVLGKHHAPKGVSVGEKARWGATGRAVLRV